eukprot:CAMPEP_0180481666 /NCGR_PEP_ID=MMETSP1036_2-20121128/34485_1 /TAXON_ID=632150 /ORGANISM="Azadinium spinosum, Strain 3D9" /LENGTH=151 /DNA_ID=CAMNT_0022489371 /DNA_START=8 /DNA_END=463 /DNA_ORIENTATION=+
MAQQAMPSQPHMSPAHCGPGPQQRGPGGGSLQPGPPVAEERAQVVLNYQERIVRLSVGGEKYTSTWETLCHSGVFSSLLKYKFDKEEIFIDRDGAPFKWILSFLRAISVGLFSKNYAVNILEHLSYTDRLAILGEAEFYEIPQLLGILKAA